MFCIRKKIGRNGHQIGFQLIELMIVIAIIGILVSIGVPLYSVYTMQANRLEAANTLSRLAIAMEEYHAATHTYQTATLALLHFPEQIAKNHYRLAIAKADDQDYLLSAIPLGQQAQRDRMCGELTMDANGEKGVHGSGKVEECW